MQFPCIYYLDIMYWPRHHDSEDRLHCKIWGEWARPASNQNTTTPSTTTSTTATTAKENEVYTYHRSTTNYFDPPAYYNKQCECGLVTGVDGKRFYRIINGRAAKPYEFPWQVGLLKTTPTYVQTVCGGILISDRWVLTAAHCIEINPNVKYEVVLGDLVRGRDDGTEQFFEVEEAVVHSDYKVVGTTPHYDFALLKLRVNSCLLLQQNCH